MPLPTEVRVKISSEAAGSIAITGVSQRLLPIRDLVEQMLGVAGKDAERIAGMLRRGSLVAGESRLRWEAIETSAAELSPVLATFPDPDPGRTFDRRHCFHVLLLSGRHRLDVSKAAASRRRLLRRRSFWDALMELAERLRPEYIEYSYRLRCDRYRVHLDGPGLAALQASAGLHPHNKTRTLAARAAVDTIELYVARS